MVKDGSSLKFFPTFSYWLTLRFFATGMSFCSLAIYYRAGKSVANRVASETCTAIWSDVRPTYMHERTNFPNDISSLDGKHCHIKYPSKAESLSYSCKLYHSLVLLPIAIDHSTYVCIDVSFKIFMAMTILVMLFQVKSPYRLVGRSQCSGEVCCLHLQP
jgi:hypothetical protein